MQLEANLLQLAQALQTGTYRHGQYDLFVVHDPKRREIAVAQVGDRIVHRLLYSYLMPIWDKTFDYDAWGCRPDKGLLAAVQRAQAHSKKYQAGWIWRGDISKFFDTIDQPTLRQLLQRRVTTPVAQRLLENVLIGYSLGNQRGMPIGNLTSQIFANIYLNQFDRYVRQELKPLAYIRYGDDFVLWLPHHAAAFRARHTGTQFLVEELKLQINPKHDLVQPAKNRLAYLGVDLWPTGRRLQKHTKARIDRQLTMYNSASYDALFRHHQPDRYRRNLQQNLFDKINMIL